MYLLKPKIPNPVLNTQSRNPKSKSSLTRSSLSLKKMRVLLRALTQLSINASTKTTQLHNPRPLLTFQKPFSTRGDGGDKEEDWTAHFGGTGSSVPDPMGWDSGASSWSTGLTKEHFDGEAVGKKVDTDPVPDQPAAARSGHTQSGRGYSGTRWTDDERSKIRRLESVKRSGKPFAVSWNDQMHETAELMKQVREPGIRGSYLKDSEKAEMYKRHKKDPEVYTVEALAKEYRIMRQRVLAILWLKQDEEEMEKKHGPLDDSVELLLDSCPEFFNSHCREFHVASLPHKPDFKVMPEGWDGTARDPDEVLYEISMKEEEMLYQEFVRNLNFNKLKVEKKVFVHKHSRRRPSEGWNFTVEKLGAQAKRGNGGGKKFVSQADGSTRPLNDIEKMFLKRETPHRRRKFLPGIL